MHVIDWIVVSLPLVIVVVIMLRTQRYVKGVSDFLAAGRVAGRYVVAVSSGEAAMGLISVVAVFQVYYTSGFAIGFWNSLAIPITMVVTLTGFAIYRYRETRAMTMGQFFEVRYSKRFRVFAGIMQSISGILNYGLFPAVGARFLVYFLDLPQQITFLGHHWPTFALVMAAFLTLAVLISTTGGQLTIMTSDCVMGILSYPMYLAVVISLFMGFSWWGDMAPALTDRPDGQSMLNPFDIQNLRDFNLFYVLVGVIGGVYSIMSWSGTQGYNAAALNAHEQKMGKILGVWRSGFSGLMIALLAVAAYTVMHGANYSEKASDIKTQLSLMALEDTASDYRPLGVLPGSNDYVSQWEAKLQAEDAGAAETYRTISKQMLVPVALREVLPIGILGAFCAIMIFLMISTDSSYMHSWGSILVQDVILPYRKRPFTPKQQVLIIRFVIVLVAIYAFLFSLFYGQVTYILMFFALTGSIYLGGAGAVIIGGLYWNRGTTQGAWAGMLTGSTMAVLGFIGTNYWTGSIYPWLANYPEVLATLSSLVETVSVPFEPWILWRVSPEKFFINGQEIYFLTMVCSIGMYVLASLLTCRQPFDMAKMLHRNQDGGSQVEQERGAKSRPAWQRALIALTGINKDFTRSDKVLSISVMVYSLGWGLGSWLVVLVWNLISPWPDEWWVNWFFISTFCIAGVIGLITTVWFTVGGSVDLYKMFKRLQNHQTNALDDGRVIDHMNADEYAEKSRKNEK